MTEIEFTEVKTSLKIIERYAKAFSAYNEAFAEAQEAKSFLNQVLKSTE
ncbi:hypothetical protein QGP82_34800 [Leptothoe sp. LEGE 181152]|nr:hypothetical protein [Leptothoe sp. LEGE 181152]